MANYTVVNTGTIVTVEDDAGTAVETVPTKEASSFLRPFSDGDTFTYRVT